MGAFERLKGGLWHLGLVAGSVLLAVCLGELLVFRFLLKATDVPRNAMIDGVIRHAPDQRGIRRVRWEIAAPYRINAQGWNSGHAEYRQGPPPGRRRLAVIGDSYVEALQVPYDRSFAELLQACLGDEVYRFGLSGSPLSHYPHVLRHAAAAYRPQVTIFLLVHNDFVESYRQRIGRYTSSFARYRLEGEGVRELPPEPYRPRWSWLHRSATYRFLAGRMLLRVSGLKERLLRRHGEEDFVANIRRTTVSREFDNIRRVTDHFLRQVRQLGETLGTRPVVLVDGVRTAIYGDDGGEALRLNGLVEALGAEHGVAVLDLHPIFAAAYEREPRPFEFRHDGHWNEHAHRLVADALCRYLQSPGEDRGEGP